MVPLFPAAVVEKTIFCCHGGLSPDLHDLDQVRFCFHIVFFSQSIILTVVENSYLHTCTCKSFVRHDALSGIQATRALDNLPQTTHPQSSKKYPLVLLSTTDQTSH